jgi:succinate dehydrogenase / fumarate reductase, cytochrome b subunit
MHRTLVRAERTPHDENCRRILSIAILEGSHAHAIGHAALRKTAVRQFDTMDSTHTPASSFALWLKRSPFMLRRLHSLTGIVPVGVFLVEHLWTNASATAGQAAFDKAVGDIQSLPFLPLIEIFGIFMPLAFHAIFGIYLLRNGNLKAGAYPHARNWAYITQRITGVLVFAFVIWHLWEFRIQKWLFGMRAEAFYPTLVSHLGALTYGIPLMAIVYLTAIAAACFHLANGLWGAGCSWGVTVSRRAQRTSGWLFGTCGIVLFLLGANTVLYLANGTRFLPFSGSSTPAADCAPSAQSAPYAMPNARGSATTAH